MNIEKETIRFEIEIFYQKGMEYISFYCYLNKSPINQYSIVDISSSYIKLKVIYEDIFSREIQHNWVFKLDITNKSLYRIIEEQIREEVKNNVYSAEDKELLKIFVKQEGHRTDDEIAEIFNEKENIIQPEIITPETEKPIISTDEDIKFGLINPSLEPNKYRDKSLLTRNFDESNDKFLFSKIIKEMYSSSAIDGTKGEISDKNLYYSDIIPFSKVKNIYLSDFHNVEYYSRYSYEYENEFLYKYILFCIYEKLKYSPYYIRYIAPIEVIKDSNMKVVEAVNDYYDSISGRVSPRYQEKIDVFQKKYR